MNRERPLEGKCLAKGYCVAMQAATTLLAGSAAGQDEKNEVGGQLGRTFISDQSIQGATLFDPVIHSGKGLTIGGEYGRRFWVAPVYSISAEGLLVYNWDGGPERGRVRALGGSFGSSETVHHAGGTRESVPHDGGFTLDQLGSRIRPCQPE